MTNNPGPPPGTPDMTPAAAEPPPGMPGSEPEAPPQPKPKKWLIALVLAVGAFFALVVLGIAVLLLSSSSASPEYCAAASNLNDQIALNDGNIDQIRFVVQEGGEVAPPEIIDEWIALDKALTEIDAATSAADAAEAGVRADAASAAIFDHSVKNCD